MRWSLHYRGYARLCDVRGLVGAGICDGALNWAGLNINGPPDGTGGGWEGSGAGGCSEPGGPCGKIDILINEWIMTEHVLHNAKT